MRSNCLIVALQYKLRNWKRIELKVRGPLGFNSWPHFYWLDRRDGLLYHYTPDSKNLDCKQLLLFTGRVKRDYIKEIEQILK